MDAKRERDTPDAKADFVAGSSASTRRCVSGDAEYGIQRAESKTQEVFTDTDESTGARTVGDDEVVVEECKGSDMNIIQHAIEYCDSRSFQDAVEAFKRSHVAAFHALAESKNPEEEEQSLDHMAVFNAYSDLLEELLLVNLLTPHKFSSTEFYHQAQDVVDGKFTALFEEHEHLWFIELMQGACVCVLMQFSCPSRSFYLYLYVHDPPWPPLLGVTESFKFL